MASASRFRIFCTSSRRGRALLPLALVFVMLASLPTLAAEPLKIGLSLGLSGKFAEPSSIQKNGYLLWEKNVNERGGIVGR